MQVKWKCDVAEGDAVALGSGPHSASILMSARRVVLRVNFNSLNTPFLWTTDTASWREKEVFCGH